MHIHPRLILVWFICFTWHTDLVAGHMRIYFPLPGFFLCSVPSRWPAFPWEWPLFQGPVHSSQKFTKWWYHPAVYLNRKYKHNTLDSEHQHLFSVHRGSFWIWKKKEWLKVLLKMWHTFPEDCFPPRDSFDIINSDVPSSHSMQNCAGMKNKSYT